MLNNRFSRDFFAKRLASKLRLSSLPGSFEMIKILSYRSFDVELKPMKLLLDHLSTFYGLEIVSGIVVNLFHPLLWTCKCQ